jgi:hypothetical protein
MFLPLPMPNGASCADPCCNFQTAKSGFFVTESEAAADAWVQRIAGALRQPNGVKPERKLSNAVANHWSGNHTTGSSSNNNNNNINHNISCART